MQIFKRLTLGLSVLMMLGLTLAVQAQTPVTPKGAGKATKQGGKHGAALAQIPVSALDFAVGGLKADQKTHITQIQDQLKADRKASAGDKTKNAELTAKATEEIQRRALHSAYRSRTGRRLAADRDESARHGRMAHSPTRLRCERYSPPDPCAVAHLRAFAA